MLFSNPVVLNDGTNDRTFTFRAQLNEAKSTVGEWIEPAATLRAESKVVVKHDSSQKSVRRRLLKHTIYSAVAADVYKPINVNFTIAYDPAHAESDLVKAAKIVGDALAEATFLQNFLRGLV